MTDKLRPVAPLNINFDAGEAPTGAKLTALNNQMRAGFKVIEQAIGDLWNNMGDPLLYSYQLQIPNLARAIGEMKYLSPPLLSGYR